jgi:hypothetical protein
VAFAAVVALPWLSVKYAPVVLAFTVLVLARLWRIGEQRRAFTLMAAFGAAAAVFAVAHLQWYGGVTPYASGSHFSGGEFTVMGDTPDYAGRATRLVGLLIDRDFGLAAWQPAYLLAVGAFVALVRDRPRGWLVLAVPLAAGWLNATFVAFTMAGWWFPGRQVVVVLPCVVVAVAWWAAQRPARVAYVVTAAVIGASVFAWFVVQGIVGDLTLVVTFESITHPLVNAWRWLLPDYRNGSTRDWALHCAWLIAIARFALRAWNVRLIPQRVSRIMGARRRPTGALVDA